MRNVERKMTFLKSRLFMAVSGDFCLKDAVDKRVSIIGYSVVLRPSTLTAQ